jgi:hypothetical protein
LAGRLLANAGGFLLPPLFVTVLHRPLKVAFDTSLAAATVLAISGTVAHAAVAHIDWAIASPLGPSADGVDNDHAGSHMKHERQRDTSDCTRLPELQPQNVTPIHMSQRRSLGVPRRAMTSRRSASTRSTLGRRCVGTWRRPTTRPSTC